MVIKEKYTNLFALVAMLFFSYPLFAQEIQDTIPEWQTQLDQLISQANAPWIAASAVILIEFLMRFVKTSDPKSLLYVVANGLKLFAKAFETLAHFIDQYLQRLKK